MKPQAFAIGGRIIVGGIDVFGLPAVAVNDRHTVQSA
jgi:hypothetical protein